MSRHSVYATLTRRVNHPRRVLAQGAGAAGGASAALGPDQLEVHLAVVSVTVTMTLPPFPLASLASHVNFHQRSPCGRDLHTRW